MTGWFPTSRECSPLRLQPLPPWLEVQIQMCVHQASDRVLQLRKPPLCLSIMEISWALAWFSPAGWNISPGLLVMGRPAQTEKFLEPKASSRWQKGIFANIPTFSSEPWFRQSQVTRGYNGVGMPSSSKTGRLRNSWSQTGLVSSIVPVLTLRPSVSSSGTEQI